MDSCENKVTFWKEFCVQFSENVEKIYFFAMEFLKILYINFDTFFSNFSHKSIIYNIPLRFLSMIFLLNFIISSYFEELD